MNTARIPLLLPICGFLVVAAVACHTIVSTGARFKIPLDATAFFYGDNVDSGNLLRFSTNGTYFEWSRGHFAITPFDRGSWTQSSKGVVLMQSTVRDEPRWRRRTAIPMIYGTHVLLVWPTANDKSSAKEVCRSIDSGRTNDWLFNEFQISGEEFTNALQSPYGFKYFKEMNAVTGAQE